MLPFHTSRCPVRCASACAALLGAALLGAAAASQTLTFQASAPDQNDRYATSVATVPDLNGDGIADLLVGAPRSDAALTAAGEVDVYDGSTGALLYSVLPPAPAVSGQFGRGVAGLTDLDGDGRGDFLVLSVQDANSTSGSDYVVDVFSGAAGTSLATLLSPNGEFNGRYGEALAGVPDTDGDGVDDFVVSASRENATLSDQGRAYLYSGATRALLFTFVSPNPEQTGLFGSQVAGVSDLDGDGRGEVLIGAEFEDDTLPEDGRVYVFSGATGSLARVLTSPDPEEDGQFGRGIAGVDDLDGDGIGDIVVTALEDEVTAVVNASTVTLSGGNVYTFSGATGALLGTLAGSEDFGDAVAVRGPVSALPDVDGDGAGDLVVGTRLALDGGAALDGQAHVFSGATRTRLTTLTSPQAAASVTFAQDVSAAAGRVLVAAREEDIAGESRAGRAYLFPLVTASTPITGAEGWRLLATPFDSPLSGFSDGVFATGFRTQGATGASTDPLGDPNVFFYDEPVQGGRDVGFSPVYDLRPDAEAGRGYAVYVFDDDDPNTAGTQGGFPKTVTLLGASRTGTDVAFPVSLSGGTTEDGWNLVGNPYTGNLDWDAPGWTKTNLSNTIYVYDAAASAYRTWNGTTGSLGSGIVAAYQGFWVKAARGTPALVSPAAAETSGSPGVPTVTAPRLALEASGAIAGEPVADGVYVAFVEGASAGFDGLDGYELAPFRDRYLSLASEAAGVALDITALPPLDGEAVVPLDVALVGGGASGRVTLRWPDLSTVPAGWALTLEDRHTGASVDLRTADAYAFDVASTKSARPNADRSPAAAPEPLATKGGTARFALRVSSAAVAAEPGAEGGSGITSIWPNPAVDRAEIAVRVTAPGDARLTLHDALGREVAVLHDGPLAPGTHALALRARGLAPGVYVARLQAGASVATRTLTLAR